jgi:endonuclease/exonuclease/phosphatase family metal-dependent hydrolase
MSFSIRGAVAARLAFVAILAASLALAFTGVAEAKNKRNLDVMTQNLYLGSSLDAALTATTPTDFLIAVATIYGTVQFTDFPARSEAIADTIDDERPDLIGLQEVTNWIATGPGAPPSLDFLAILQQDLADRGLNYSVASVSNNANIGPVPLVSPCSGPVGACTVTLQDRDVILVNDDNPNLTMFNPQSGLYQTQATVTTPVGVLSFDRGWATIDGRFNGKRFRLANTHLETEAFPAEQVAQGDEFLARPARTSGAVIATGDFNSAADGSTTATYANLTSGNLRDAWNTNPGDPGYTCCQNSTLTNTTSQLASRIDLILATRTARALSAEVVNDTPFQATPPFWPSDHAGVIATLRLH